MSETGNIYKQAPREEKKPSAPGAPPRGPGDAPPHRRAILVLVAMAALLAWVAYYFYEPEDAGLETAIVEKPLKLAASTGEVAEASAPEESPENAAIASLLADLGTGAQQAASTLSPLKMAEAMAFVRAAQQYVRDRDMDSAEREIGKALTVWPDMNMAIRLLGSLYTQRGQFDNAIALLERSLEREPFSAETLNNLAINYMQKGMMSKAEELLNTSLQIRPDYAVGQMNLAFVHLRLSRFEEAAEFFELALRQMPGNQGAINNLAVCLMRIGNYERSRQLLQEMIDSAPERPIGYFNMAITYVLERNEDEAMNWVRRGSALCSSSQLQMFLSDPDFNPIRATPAFQELARQSFPDIPSRGPNP